VPDPWSGLDPGAGYHTDQQIEIDMRPAGSVAYPSSQPARRTFDFRPRLDPPAEGRDKLDQLLDWLAVR
jgi:hypothetical protein